MRDQAQLTPLSLAQLKKVINRVANELKDLGLTSEVLKELLQQPGATAAAGPSSPPKPAAAPLPSSGTLRWADQEGAGSGSDDEKNGGSEARIEEVLDEVEGVVEAEEEDGAQLSEKAKGKQKAVRKRRVRASYELGGASCLSLSLSLRVARTQADEPFRPSQELPPTPSRASTSSSPRARPSRSPSRTTAARTALRPTSTTTTWTASPPRPPTSSSNGTPASARPARASRSSRASRPRARSSSWRRPRATTTPSRTARSRTTRPQRRSPSRRAARPAPRPTTRSRCRRPRT